MQRVDPPEADGRARETPSGRLARGGFATILFDADGTLFDFERAEAYSLETAYSMLNGQWSEELLPVYERINSSLWRELEQGRITTTFLRRERFARFCREAGARCDPDSLAARYIELLSSSAFLIDGAEEVVRRLRGRHRLAIITNGLSDVQRSRIGSSSLAGLFDEIVISEEVGVQKPEAEIFRITLERLGAQDRSRAIMVGDSLTSDIQGGVNFGIATCLLDRDGRHASAAGRGQGERRAGRDGNEPGTREPAPAGQDRTAGAASGEGGSQPERRAAAADGSGGRPRPDWVISTLRELLPIVED